MAADLIFQSGAQYHYSAAGTNTISNVSASPVTLYNIEVNALGSPGYLHIYDNGSTEAGVGTPNLVFRVGEFGVRSISFGAPGIKLSGGLSYLWGTAATGTAVVAGNAIVNITYQGTAR